MSAKFHFINHACFILEKNNSAIIFDPYLDDNPEGLTAKDIKVDYIFVSHGHFDHLGSAFEIAKIVTLPSSPLPKSAVWRRMPAAKHTLCILVAPLSFPSARYA